MIKSNLEILNLGKWKKDLMEVFLLFLTITLFVFKFEATRNEMDVIPFARATYDPSWLPEDWYLNLEITYRFLFDYPIGFMVDQIGPMATIVTGRLFSYLLFAVSLVYLARALQLRLPWLLVSVALSLSIFSAGYGAGEWMIGSLETKAFASSSNYGGLFAGLLRKRV